MVYQWVTQCRKGSIDNAWRPGRGSMMRPTINEESDCLRGKNLHTSRSLARNFWRRELLLEKDKACTAIR